MKEEMMPVCQDCNKTIPKEMIHQSKIHNNTHSQNEESAAFGKHLSQPHAKLPFYPHEDTFVDDHPHHESINLVSQQLDRSYFYVRKNIISLSNEIKPSIFSYISTLRLYLSLKIKKLS